FLAHAYQVDMRNGDRYFGKILSLTSNTVVLESSILGKVQLPRVEVASMAFGTTNQAITAASKSAATAVTATNQLDSLVRQLAGEKNAIRKVQQDILAGAGPEATQKFNQMLSDLSTGKLTVQGLRNEAASAAKQLKDLKSGLGEEAG